MYSGNFVRSNLAQLGITPRGRPTVLTPQRREAIVRLMAEGTSRNRAARLVGCAPSTITYGALRDPQFGRAVARARAVHLRRLSRTILQAAGCKEQSAQPKFLFDPQRDAELKAVAGSHPRELKPRCAPQQRSARSQQTETAESDQSLKRQLAEQAARDPTLLAKLAGLLKQAERFMPTESNLLAAEIADDFETLALRRQT